VIRFGRKALANVTKIMGSEQYLGKRNVTFKQLQTDLGRMQVKKEFKSLLP